MLFLGGTFLNGDVMSIACSPTNIDEVSNIKLTNGYFDDLYVSAKPLTPSSTDYGNFSWGWDTVLYAKFQGSTDAGNLEFDVSDITAVLIKRRLDGENAWTTIESKEVNSIDDLIIVGEDITPTNGKYTYAVTFYIDGAETAYYESEPIDVKIGCLVMVDGSGEIWETYATDGFCDTTNVTPSQVIETMYSKYPTIVSNSITNYQTISVSGNWMPFDCSDYDPNEFLDDAKRVKRNKALIAFLTNRRPKVLKNIDGREWLIYVTTPPTDAAQDYYKIRQISFECTEIGDINNEEDLYDAGIINTSPAYWSYSS